MIKNIVFDIGNVLVKWNPTYIVSQTFPDHENHAALAQQIFKSKLWLDHNYGMFTEEQIIQQYHRTLGIPVVQLNRMMDFVKESQTPVDGSHKLLDKIYDANFPLYALSDNTREIVAYLKKKYNFWHKFTGIVISAEVGSVKPNPEIYHHLLNKYQLNAYETIFIDDIAANIEAAKALKMHGIVFQNTEQCINELRNFNVVF